MFSGENAPVAYALAWCGWRVEPVDWLLNSRHDLSKPDVQHAVATQVQACDAATWAVDCSTLSRAREVAIPGHHAAPKPLRAENEVRGLCTLTGRDATRVEQANLFIDFTFAQIALSVSAGKAAVLEPPARSHLWGFQQLKDIRKLPGWRHTLYNACCRGGARSKKQALESNVAETDELRCSTLTPDPSGLHTVHRMDLGSTLPQVRQNIRLTWRSLLQSPSVGGRYALERRSCTSLVPLSCKIQATVTDGRICHRKSCGAG